MREELDALTLAKAEQSEKETRNITKLLQSRQMGNPKCTDMKYPMKKVCLNRLSNYYDGEIATELAYANAAGIQKNTTNIEGSDCVQSLDLTDGEKMLVGTANETLKIFNIKTARSSIAPKSLVVRDITEFLGKKTDTRRSFGIRTIKSNPTGTLVGIQGRNPNEVLFFSTQSQICQKTSESGLENLVKVATAKNEGKRQGSITGLCWLNENVAVTSSKDGSLQMWDLEEACEEEVKPRDEISFPEKGLPMTESGRMSPPGFPGLNKLLVSTLMDVDYYQQKEELMTCSATGDVFISKGLDLEPQRFVVNRNAETFPGLMNIRISSQSLEHNTGQFSVACTNDVHMLDAKAKDGFVKIPVISQKHSRIYRHNDWKMGYRINVIKASNNIITVGLESGALLFVDIRQRKIIEDEVTSARVCWHLGHGTSPMNASSNYLSGDIRYSVCAIETKDHMTIAAGGMPRGEEGAAVVNIFE